MLEQLGQSYPPPPGTRCEGSRLTCQSPHNVGVGVAVGSRLLSVRKQLRRHCLGQSAKAVEDRDLPDGLKLGTSPDKPRAQPCRPVWARVELCSRSQEDSHQEEGKM